MAIAEAGIILLLVLVLYGLERLRVNERMIRDAAHERVLREMANRIQRPQLVTPERVEHFELPEPEPDESSAVGTIVWDDRYAERDDMPMPETVEID